RYLAETIGPRGSTRSGERKAAQYAAGVLAEAGMEPKVEPFRSARSAYYPYLAFSVLFLVSELFFLFGGGWGAVAAILLSLLGLLSILLELAFCPNPFRWVLPKGDSQNVWVRIEPRQQARQKVVLLGHLDSHRTPLIFSSERWLKFFGTLVPLGLGSSLLLILLFGIGIVVEAWIWAVLSIPFALLHLIIFTLMIQADLTPFSAGANDNASGAALVLSTALRLKDEPLAHTEVWSVLTGCEEVACYGADAFTRTHQDELGEVIWLTADSVGTAQGDPTYTVSETFLLASQSDPGLVKMAEQIAEDHPELRIKPHIFKGAYSEGAIGGKYKFRVLSFGSSRRDGSQPEWHRMTDVIDKVDAGVVERCERFIWEVLRSIDRQ
ncbi:MAG: M28 family peptidase, partial [Anaerolineales bacterium]|nr:M28 family peptidase [Anaerolineales bacterium]